MTKKQLTHLGVTYTETRLDEHPEIAKAFTDQGLMQAPIVKAGTEIWSGFRLGKIRAIKVNHQDE
jgi:glutaredoxin